MKLIDEKQVEQVACDEMQQDWNDLRFQSVFKDGFKQGAEFAESILLPKMIEFAKWCVENNEPIHWDSNVTYWNSNNAKFEDEPISTPELLDIWINEYKKP